MIPLPNLLLKITLRSSLCILPLCSMPGVIRAHTLLSVHSQGYSRTHSPVYALAWFHTCLTPSGIHVHRLLSMHWCGCVLKILSGFWWCWRLNPGPCVLDRHTATELYLQPCMFSGQCQNPTFLHTSMSGFKNT